MAEKIADVIADLEKAKEYEGPSAPGWPGLRMSGLSQGAELVLEKLRSGHPTDGLHRAYRRTPRRFDLADLLTDWDIETRGYQPTKADPVAITGDSALTRDTIREHQTANDLYDDLWIGERLEE